MSLSVTAWGRNALRVVGDAADSPGLIILVLTCATESSVMFCVGVGAVFV